VKKTAPKSVDEYIAAQPEAVRPKLEQVREALTEPVPVKLISRIAKLRAAGIAASAKRPRKRAP